MNYSGDVESMLPYAIWCWVDGSWMKMVEINDKKINRMIIAKL